MAINPFLYIRQFFNALGKCCVLIYFSIREAQLIHSLYKSKNHFLCKIEMLLMPLRRCSALFNPNVLVYGLNSNMDNKYYRNVYKAMCSLPEPAVHILPDESVCDLQAYFIRQSFHDVLGINISLHQARALSYNGGVSLIVKKFLENCGCPYTPISRNDLKHNVRSYVSQSKTMSLFRFPKQSNSAMHDQFFDQPSFPRLKKRLLTLLWRWNCFMSRMATKQIIIKVKNQQMHTMRAELHEVMNRKTGGIYEQIVLEIQLQALVFIITMETMNDGTREQDLTETITKLTNNYKKIPQPLRASS